MIHLQNKSVYLWCKDETNQTEIANAVTVPRGERQKYILLWIHDEPWKIQWVKKQLFQVHNQYHNCKIGHVVGRR